MAGAARWPSGSGRLERQISSALQVYVAVAWRMNTIRMVLAGTLFGLIHRTLSACECACPERSRQCICVLMELCVWNLCHLPVHCACTWVLHDRCMGLLSIAYRQTAGRAHLLRVLNTRADKQACTEIITRKFPETLAKVLHTGQQCGGPRPRNRVTCRPHLTAVGS